MLSVLPNILLQAIKKTVAYDEDNVVLIYLDSNDYTIQKNTENVLDDSPSSTTSVVECDQQKQMFENVLESYVVDNNSTVVDVPPHPSSNRKRKSTVVSSSLFGQQQPSSPPHKKTKQHHYKCDNPITYTQFVASSVQPTTNSSEFVKIVRTLSFNAFKTDVPLGVATHIIGKFVAKDIKNSMSKRKSKSKKTTRNEKAITKNFIRFLQT